MPPQEAKSQSESLIPTQSASEVHVPARARWALWRASLPVAQSLKQLSDDEGFGALGTVSDTLVVVVLEDSGAEVCGDDEAAGAEVGAALTAGESAVAVAVVGSRGACFGSSLGELQLAVAMNAIVRRPVRIAASLAQDHFVVTSLWSTAAALAASFGDSTATSAPPDRARAP